MIFSAILILLDGIEDVVDWIVGLMFRQFVEELMVLNVGMS